MITTARTADTLTIEVDRSGALDLHGLLVVQDGPDEQRSALLSALEEFYMRRRASSNDKHRTL